MGLKTEALESDLRWNQLSFCKLCVLASYFTSSYLVSS